MSLFNRVVESVSGVMGLAVPIVRQSTSYTCGAAAMLSVLRYWKIPASSERDLSKAMRTSPKSGTEVPVMAALARHLGLRADVIVHMTLDALRRRLLSGETVILGIQRAGRQVNPLQQSAGHYVVLVALDNNMAYVMDPWISTSRYGEIPLPVFKKAWVDGDGVIGHAIAIKGSSSLGRKLVSNPQKVITGREHTFRHEDETLFDRLAEMFGGVPQARNVGGSEFMLAPQPRENFIRPMKNDLPGNMNPRNASAALGTKWHDTRLARQKGDAIKALTPPPSLIKRTGDGEPGMVSPARRPPPNQSSIPKPPVKLPSVGW